MDHATGEVAPPDLETVHVGDAQTPRLVPETDFFYSKRAGPFLSCNLTLLLAVRGDRAIKRGADRGLTTARTY
jgi:hypothetical protein